MTFTAQILFNYLAKHANLAVPIGSSRLGENCTLKLQHEFMSAEADQPFTGKQLRTFAMMHHLDG